MAVGSFPSSRRFSSTHTTLATLLLTSWCPWPVLIPFGPPLCEVAQRRLEKLFQGCFPSHPGIGFSLSNLAYTGDTRGLHMVEPQKSKQHFLGNGTLQNTFFSCLSFLRNKKTDHLFNLVVDFSRRVNMKKTWPVE